MKRLALLCLFAFTLVACQEDKLLTGPSVLFQTSEVDPEEVEQLIKDLYPGTEGEPRYNKSLEYKALRKWHSIVTKMAQGKVDDAQRKATELVTKTVRYLDEGKLELPAGYASVDEAVDRLSFQVYRYSEVIPPEIPDVYEAEEFAVGIVDQDGDVVESTNELIRITVPPDAVTEEPVLILTYLHEDKDFCIENGGIKQAKGCWEAKRYPEGDFAKEVSVEACMEDPWDDPANAMSDEEWDMIVLWKNDPTLGRIPLAPFEPTLDCGSYEGAAAPAASGIGGLASATWKVFQRQFARLLAPRPLIAGAVAGRPPKGAGGMTGSFTEFFGAPAPLAFHSNRDGNFEVYGVQEDGELRRLTYDPAQDGHPKWSPDASKIAFHSDRSTNWDIWIVNADGSGLTQLTTNPYVDRHPVWTADGLQIAFASTRAFEDDAVQHREIYIMNADGAGTPQRVTDNLVLDNPHSFSPDGGKLAITRYNASLAEVWILDLSNPSNDYKVPTLGEAGSPHFSPDGGRLAVEQGTEGGLDIWVYDLGGGAPPQNLTGALPGNHHRPSWSADGRQIVFGSTWDGDVGTLTAPELYTMRADGSDPLRLTENSFTDNEPHWRPAPELCNSLDDDDDGLTDEGMRYCFGGSPAPKTDGWRCDEGWLDTNGDPADGCEVEPVYAPPVNVWSTSWDGGTTNTFQGVWGTSTANVYALNVHSWEILHYDGAGWSTVATPGFAPMAIWGTSATDIFVVGSSGGILHHNGAAWTEMSSPTSAALAAVWGTASDNVYASGYSGTIIHYDGVSWSPVRTGAGELTGLWGSSPTDIYAVGSDYPGHVMLHYDGVSWDPVDVTHLTTLRLNDVWGTSGSNVFVVGEHWILHFDGADWSATSAGVPWLNSVSGSSQNDVWSTAVYDGKILHYDGLGWSVNETGTDSWLADVWTEGMGDVFVAGGGDFILRGVRNATVVVDPIPTLTLGTSIEPTATAFDGSLNAIGGVSFMWMSDDPVVATISVDIDGVPTLTATGEGVATITATAPGGASGSAAIEVTLTEWASVSAGIDHNCGVTWNGDAFCWGRGDYGQLGNGTTTDSYAPSPVDDLGGTLTWAAVTAGAMNTCGLTVDGDAYCWGRNDYGRLGDGTTTQRITPTLVLGGHSFASIVLGNSHTCGVTQAGDTYCWGNNSHGQLGTTVDPQSTTPIAADIYVLGLDPSTVASVSGGGLHTCGVTTGGVAFCFGRNVYGRFGEGWKTGDGPTPVLAFNYDGVGVVEAEWSSMAAGGQFTCADSASAGSPTGTVYCAGANNMGQLGDGSTDNSWWPTPLAGGLSIASVSAGDFHSCSITTGGDAYCWGRNQHGELGLPPTGETCDLGVSCSTTPVLVSDPVSGPVSFAGVSTATPGGGIHSCGVTTDGAAFCWGYNLDGRLGDGTFTSSATPVRVQEPAP